VWNHLDADVAAQRPAEDNRVGDSEFAEQLNGSVGKPGERVGPLRIRRIAGLTVTREIECDETLIRTNELCI
jgi:hypothetical protein